MALFRFRNPFKRLKSNKNATVKAKVRAPSRVRLLASVSRNSPKKAATRTHKNTQNWAANFHRNLKNLGIKGYTLNTYKKRVPGKGRAHKLHKKNEPWPFPSVLMNEKNPKKNASWPFPSVLVN